jgi:tetratricopeptide (TPR) repeat protein
MPDRRDGLKQLMREHRQIERLYDAFHRAPTSDAQARYRVAHLLCFRVAAHSLLETQLMYPMLREAGMDPDFIDEAIIEQVLQEEIISAIVRGGPHGAELEQRVNMLGQLAREQARIAQAHATRAETVRKFLVGVFEHASPDSSGGKAISARDLLAKGEQQAATGLRGEPAVEADVLALLGQLYIEIGDFDVARGLLQRALELSAGPSIPVDVRIRTLTGMARIDGETGLDDEAIAHAREALALIDEVDPAAAADVAKAHELIAHALVSKGELTSVEAMLRTNLARHVLSVSATLRRD